MGSNDPRFGALVGHGVSTELAEALRRFTDEAEDHELGRINVLDFAARYGFEEDRVVDAFVVASRIGLFDMAWNLLCPGCGGVLGSGATLRDMDKPQFPCALCAARYEMTLDETVEVNFCVVPSVRSIPAHDPDSMSHWQFFRQLHFSPSLLMPTGPNWDRLTNEINLALYDIPPGGVDVRRLTLPPEFLIVFEPVLHAAVFVDAKGEPTADVQELSIVLTPSGPAPSAIHGVRPGPALLRIENRTERRTLPGVFIANDEFHHLLTKRPYLTAKRLFCNQVFRDLYRAEFMKVDQRMKIANLTMLFTDLKGSTELYDRVGDLVAYEMVRAHFGVLGGVVREHGGAVVKTIGDAVMATFPDAGQAVEAALSMRDGIDRLNAEGAREDLVVKIGLHQGGCLAVVSNERLDYFGQTVNIAARVQALAEGRAIYATRSVLERPSVPPILAAKGLVPQERRVTLKGIRDEMVVFEIP
jgi:class 3 adenylate cyclase